jgi:hypothetical protein
MDSKFSDKNSFKQGDRLICIDGVADIPTNKTRPLTGKIYTFDKYSLRASVSKESWVFVKELPSDWYARRFILATPLLEALL